MPILDAQKDYQRMPTESSLQTAFLLRAPERLPDIRLFRRNVVAVQIGGPRGRGIRAGIKGQSDIYGYIRGGRCIEIELKGARTPVTPEQRAWTAWCEAWGVPCVTLRAQAGETTEATVERWCAEIETLVVEILAR